MSESNCPPASQMPCATITPHLRQIGQGSGLRPHDLLLPEQALHQTELYPVKIVGKVGFEPTAQKYFFQAPDSKSGWDSLPLHFPLKFW